jgi:uncharacterized protein YhaN
MKKNLLFILLLALLALPTRKTLADEVKELRKKYKAALDNVPEAENLYKELSARSITDPVVSAYLGACQALMAKNVKALKKKMGYMKASEQTFDTAIQKAPDNIEIRFLRFATNHHLPALLKDKKRMTEDKNVIIENLPKAARDGIGKDFKKEIVDFLLSSGTCTPEEEKKLKDQLI